MDFPEVLPSALLKSLSAMNADENAAAEHFRKTLARESEPFGIAAKPPAFKSAADEARTSYAHLDAVKALFEPRIPASTAKLYSDPVADLVKSLSPEPISYIHVESQQVEGSVFGMAALTKKKPAVSEWDQPIPASEAVVDKSLKKFAEATAIREQCELLAKEAAITFPEETAEAIEKAIFAIADRGATETENEYFARIDAALVELGHPPVLTSQS
jgi:hypothetical protein